MVAKGNLHSVLARAENLETLTLAFTGSRGPKGYPAAIEDVFAQKTWPKLKGLRIEHFDSTDRP